MLLTLSVGWAESLLVAKNLLLVSHVQAGLDKFSWRKKVITICFPSKRDRFYSIAVWGTIVILLLSIILNFSFAIFNLIWGLIGLVAIGFLIWIWFGTSYGIENETIIIKNGPFKSMVKIQDINSISKRRTLLATPSLSIDRLVLHYGKYGEMLLSPKDESEFIELLLIKNPQIKLKDKVSDA